MNDLIEKIYDLYLTLLINLEQGYPLSNKNVSEIWELIQVVDFMANGHPTESELLFIADKYETVKSSLINEDVDDLF